MSIIHTDLAARGSARFHVLVARIIAALAAGVAHAERSHHRRLGFAAVTPEMLADVRMSAEEMTGLPNHQADLPFFMQTGFGRR